MNTSRKKVLVTGAGTGMGLEAARRFSAEGATVLMVARNGDRLRREAARLDRAVPIVCDIADEDDVASLLRLITSEHADLDTVFLNAGITHTYRLLDRAEDPVANAEAEMRVNYLSAVRLTNELVPVLEQNPDPALIVTTSGVAFAPDISNPTYSATKAALHSLTLSLRLQLERNGSKIKVFEFMAPLVDSPFSSGVVSEDKVSVADAVAELFDGLARDELELHAGITQDVYNALRISSDAAVRAVNVATGG